MDILIIACSQRKRDPRDLPGSITLHDGTPVAPAWAVYDGTQMRIVRKYAPYRGLAFGILSARFGLIDSSHKIPNYDHKMTAAQVADPAWIKEKITERMSLVQILTYQTIFTCLPRLYGTALIAGLSSLGIAPVSILKDGRRGQGYMAQALKTFCLERRV